MPLVERRLATRVLQAGAIAVVLAAAPYKTFELDRFFVPKELLLSVTAGVALRRTSFGTKNRSSSKVLYGAAASTTAIAPTWRMRVARRRSASGMRRMAR
jgi:hypothetical protein